MIRFQLLTVGKIREKWIQQGAAEYIKRLNRMAKVTVTEMPDQPCPAGNTEEDQARNKEGDLVLARINPRSYVIALDVGGNILDSPGLAALFQDLTLKGISDITFIIGGSLGLSRDVLARADLRLSFSAFTFPHQLMRVILLEQIYRACKINAGETYHK